ncbi:capsule assembly Wzi family protein [Marinilabiliaceae bacterium ANBcel2]|nr:capsule assembly Wzi family protein [Marinilabiliaceae bacterium ANBcel2]
MNPKLHFFFKAVKLTSILFLLQTPAVTQVQTGGEASIITLTGGGDAVPLWMYSREEGRWSHNHTSQFITEGSGYFNYNINDSCSLKAEATILHNNRTDDLMLHKGYISASWNFLSLTAGKHTFDPIFEESYSGHGSYLYGDNNRPLPRITAGIPSYLTLPSFLSLFAIKGEISHAYLDDRRSNATHSHKRTLLHEKYAYVRLNSGNWKPYFGLNHSALMGGYRYNHSSGEHTESIPIDYWPSFVASGSEEIGGGEETNAAGGHMGLYDFGIYHSNSAGEFKIYYQAPFADGSGMNLKRNSDQIAGVNWQPANISFLNNLTVEWINTHYQSGKGMPDIIMNFPDEEGKRLIINSELEDRELRERIMIAMGQPEGDYTKSEVQTFLRNELNEGHRYGGRDGYMNNGVYPAGWTYHGRIMGSPLNLTQNQLTHIDGEFGSYNRTFIINDRFKGIHIGAEGNISNSIKWKTKLTYSKNYGSYYQEYPGRYTWNRTVDYYFDGGKNQLYSLINIEWHPPIKGKNIIVSATFACDRGDIYDSNAIKSGIKWLF